MSAPGKKFSVPFKLLLFSLGSIFLTESAVMFLVPHLSGLPPWKIALIDAALVSLIITPVFYFAQYRPMENEMLKRLEAGKDLNQARSELDIKSKHLSMAEEELFASEEQYRLVFEANPISMWFYDMDTLKFLAVNESTISNYGYSKNEFLSMTIKDIRPAQDIPRLDDFFRAIKTPVRVSGTWRHLKKNGTVIQAEIYSHITKFQGKEARFVISFDITERKKAEETLKKLNMELQDALGNVKALSGLLPICANCKNIRDDNGYWNQIEKYIREHSEADFSHSICPDCAKKLYPDVYEE